MLGVPARLLADGAPGGGTTSDRSAIEQGTVPRTTTPFLPATMDQPILRRFTPVSADRFQRRTADRAADAPQFVLLRGAQISGWRGRMHLDLPHNFIGHPVANS